MTFISPNFLASLSYVYQITYFLDRTSSVGHFKIHPDTGELTVSEALDREEQDRFNLIVQAYDNYQFGFTLGESRHTFTQVKCQIPLLDLHYLT